MKKRKGTEDLTRGRLERTNITLPGSDLSLTRFNLYRSLFYFRHETTKEKWRPRVFVKTIFKSVLSVIIQLINMMDGNDR